MRGAARKAAPFLRPVHQNDNVTSGRRVATFVKTQQRKGIFEVNGKEVAEAQNWSLIRSRWWLGLPHRDDFLSLKRRMDDSRGALCAPRSESCCRSNRSKGSDQHDGGVSLWGSRANDECGCGDDWEPSTWGRLVPNLRCPAGRVGRGGLRVLVGAGVAGREWRRTYRRHAHRHRARLDPAPRLAPPVGHLGAERSRASAAGSEIQG